MDEEEFRAQSIEKLIELGKKIDALIQVVAIASRRESMLEGKSKTDQIELLSGLDLPKTVIAWIVGSTPEAVRVRLSQIKGKKPRARKITEEESSD